MNARHLASALLAVDQQSDLLGVGPKRAHYNAVGLHVSAENGMRIKLFQGDQPLQAVRRILTVSSRYLGNH
jgi:hypothetical protein